MKWMGWSYSDLLECPMDMYLEIVALMEEIADDSR